MAELHAAAGRQATGGTAREAADKITLGKAPQEPHARRPEWFSPKDVAPFELHEVAIQRLSQLEGQALVEAWTELDLEARRLASVVIVSSQDLARCPRLLVLDLEPRMGDFLNEKTEGLFWALAGACQRNGVGGIIVQFIIITSSRPSTTALMADKRRHRNISCSKKKAVLSFSFCYL